ncbi:MAG: hypothetical protein WCK67_10505 [bacterium]
MVNLNPVSFKGIYGTVKTTDGKTKKLEDIKPELKQEGSILTIGPDSKLIIDALKGYNSIESVKITKVDKNSTLVLDNSNEIVPDIEIENTDNAYVDLLGNSTAKITGTAKDSQINVSDNSKLNVEKSLDTHVSQFGGELNIDTLSSNYPIPEYDKKHTIKKYAYNNPVDEDTVRREGVNRVESTIKDAKEEVKFDTDFAKGKLREYLTSHSTVVVSGENSIANVKNAENGTLIHHANEKSEVTVNNLEKGSKLIAPGRYSEKNIDIKKLIASLTDRQFEDSIRDLCKKEARHTLGKMNNRNEKDQLVNEMVETRLTKVEDHKRVKKQRSEVSISQEEAGIIIDFNRLDPAKFSNGMDNNEASEYKKNHVKNNNGGEIISNTKYSYQRVGNTYDDSDDNVDRNYFAYRNKRDAVQVDSYNLEPFTNRRDYEEKYKAGYDEPV